LFLAFGASGMLVGGLFPAAPIPVVVGSAVVVVLFGVVLRPMPQRLRPAAMRAAPVSLTSQNLVTSAG